MEEEKNEIELFLKTLNSRKKKIQKYTKRIRKNSKKSEKEKTEVKNLIIKKNISCEFYKVGNCIKGDLCEYSHLEEPSVQKDKLCKYHLIGGCQKNPCYFSHNLSDFACKYLFISGKCDKNSSCKFSHEGFQSLRQMNDFIKENQNAIVDHLRNSIFVPLSLYALQQGLITLPSFQQDFIINDNNVILGEKKEFVEFLEGNQIFNFNSEIDGNFLGLKKNAFSEQKNLEKFYSFDPFG